MAEAKKRGSGRINLWISADLAEWAREYAAKRGTSMSEMIREYFKRLRDEQADQQLKF